MEGFWKGVRNVAALVGVIWVGLQGYNFFFVNSYDLKAFADTNEFHVPRQTIIGGNDFVGEENFIMNSKLKNLGLVRQYQTIINISNEGDKQTKDIYLLTNGMDCSYQFVDSAGKFKDGKSGNKIALGNLLANEKIKVIVWHGYMLNDNELSLTFPEGSFEIEYSQRFNGIIADIASIVDSMGYFLLLPLLWIISLFIVPTRKSENEEDIHRVQSVAQPNNNSNND